MASEPLFEVSAAMGEANLNLSSCRGNCDGIAQACRRGIFHPTGDLLCRCSTLCFRCFNNVNEEQGEATLNTLDSDYYFHLLRDAGHNCRHGPSPVVRYINKAYQPEAQGAVYFNELTQVVFPHEIQPEVLQTLRLPLGARAFWVRGTGLDPTALLECMQPVQETLKYLVVDGTFAQRLEIPEGVTFPEMATVFMNVPARDVDLDSLKRACPKAHVSQELEGEARTAIQELNPEDFWDLAEGRYARFFSENEKGRKVFTFSHEEGVSADTYMWIANQLERRPNVHATILYIEVACLNSLGLLYPLVLTLKPSRLEVVVEHYCSSYVIPQRSICRSVRKLVLCDKQRFMNIETDLGLCVPALTFFFPHLRDLYLQTAFPVFLWGAQQRTFKPLRTLMYFPLPAIGADGRRIIMDRMGLDALIPFLKFFSGLRNIGIPDSSIGPELADELASGNYGCAHNLECMGLQRTPLADDTLENQLAWHKLIELSPALADSQGGALFLV